MAAIYLRLLEDGSKTSPLRVKDDAAFAAKHQHLGESSGGSWLIGPDGVTI